MKNDIITPVLGDGYRGIWYSNQPVASVHRYKYSGGLGTYCAKHIPMAIHAPSTGKTFFCYGSRPAGENRLLHAVSWYDHDDGKVPQPRILLDKNTNDAHDNPTMLIDDQGYVHVFSSAHGISRPAFIHKSVEPWSIDAFSLVYKGNYSYPQAWFMQGKGILFLHTSYYLGRRFLSWCTSPDGKTWSDRSWLAGIERGHYQVSYCWQGKKVGTTFNMHPERGGLNHRTNLYYLETDDMGDTWTTVAGEIVEPPIVERDNAALIRDYTPESRLVYLKDLNFDPAGNPIILFVLSQGFEPGLMNGPREWWVGRWTGVDWNFFKVAHSDSNYDMGCLHVLKKANGKVLEIIAPLAEGPQPGNPGGEMVVMVSNDGGITWQQETQLTSHSKYNHTYARRPVEAVKDFWAFWADGDCRQLSRSALYFLDRTQNAVYQLPVKMEERARVPRRVF